MSAPEQNQGTSPFPPDIVGIVFSVKMAKRFCVKIKKHPVLRLKLFGRPQNSNEGENMPSSIDCSLCLLRQSLEAARFASSDPAIHEKIIRQVVIDVLEMGFETPPPRIGQKLHRTIREMTNNPDPYLHVKQKFNDLMLSRIDHFRDLVKSSADPFETAVRLAIAGNTIDFAIRANLEAKDIDEAVEQALRQPINGDVNELRQIIEKADKILYLADNAGEIVCDRLLIEHLLPKDVTACVRGLPIINDATLDDAKQVGLTEIVPVISNGNDGMGTMLEQCSQEFMAVFHEADLIISKGLGNYETLICYDKTALPQPIAFLFKAKCEFIAQFSGTQLGDCVIRIQK